MATTKPRKPKPKHKPKSRRVRRPEVQLDLFAPPPCGIAVQGALQLP